MPKIKAPMARMDHGKVRSRELGREAQLDMTAHRWALDRIARPQRKDIPVPVKMQCGACGHKGTAYAPSGKIWKFYCTECGNRI